MGRRRLWYWLGPLLFSCFIWTYPVIFVASDTFTAGDGRQWLHSACGLELDWGSSIYPPRAGWHFYHVQAIHERRMYRLSESRILGATGAFRQELRQLDETGSSTNANLIRCIRADAQAPLDDRAFVDLLVAENTTQAESDLYYFEQRWQRSKRRGYTALFELAILFGWWAFTFWPRFRPEHNLGWAFHLGFSPFVALLPFYLGYGSLILFTFRSTGFTPYPMLASLISIPFLALGLPGNRVDVWLFTHIPPIFDYFNQTSGPFVSITDHGFPAPTIVFLFGAAATAMGYLWRRWRQRQPR